MKNALITVGLISMVRLASADARPLSFESRDPGCPNELKISEKYEGEYLRKIMVIKDRTDDQYIAEKLLCENLDGKPVQQNDGSILTCNLTDTGLDESYSLAIVYEEPSRDPSDYGLLRKYTIEKSSNEVRAHWDARRWYDGSPIYCHYRRKHGR